ncbi:putative casein kinase ii beta 2 subunit protein [Eutypa lata UCREL1]|uniref:Putative casein kinase ii beta 2 subunit protein n=1 Tax=Eutypa lata (strain UCR-EL1) TaxID=1287681 RepID=M7T6P4_EUTLA|nr:putative casein kinase ii beta 2 subunit protein [Eutypa lata UCREL1]
MSAPGGILAPAAMKLVRNAALKASKIIRAKLANATRPVNTALEPVLARTNPRQPIHPSALLRQQKNRRWHSTTSTYRNINAAVRRFMSTGRLQGAPRLDRSKFLNTQTGRAVAQFTGRAPFASTLRPNLTGGALPRTAGGYGLGSGHAGGARYFSHTPAAPAQVVQNVSAAVRAFWVSGQKAQFDGLTARGEKQYRAVSAKQDEATRKMAMFPRITPGSYVDFRLNPTVTALSPLAAAFPFPSAGSKVAAFDDISLNTEGFIDVLSGDFARAVKDLTATLADIHRLCSLGDLPIQLEKGHILRVRFPGVDADTVESLCDDLGLTRGTVGEDLNFEEETGVPIALRFPFAPGVGTEDTQTLTSPGGSLRSEDSFPADELLFESLDEMAENPWLSSPDLEGYESMSPPISSGEHVSEDFEGLEGIYRFLEECDRSRDGFH